MDPRARHTCDRQEKLRDKGDHIPAQDGPNRHLGTYLVGVLLMVLIQRTMASTSTRCKGSIRIPMPRDAKPGSITTLNYCYGIATVFELDICRMMNCGLHADYFYKAEKYLCIATEVTGYYRGSSACKTWAQASWFTHPGYKEGYYPKGAPWTGVQKEISMCKEMDGKTVRRNLILLTLKAGLAVPGLGRLPHQKEDNRGFSLLLGIDVGGEDPMVQVYLQARRCAAGKLAPGGSNGDPKIASISLPQVFSPEMEDPEVQGDTWKVETGGLYEKMWVNWINYTARAQGKTNCIICASGRPRLTTAPARITLFNSAEGFACLLGLFVEGHIIGCPDSRDAPIPLFYKPIRCRYFYLCTCRYRVPILSRFGLYERSAINLKAVFISSSEDYVKPLVRLYKMNRRLFQAKDKQSFLV